MHFTSLGLFCSSRLSRQIRRAEPLPVTISPCPILLSICSVTQPIKVQENHTFCAPLHSPWHFSNLIVSPKNQASCDAFDLPWFVKVQNMDHCDTFFSPPPNYRKSHVFHVVVLKKDTFQVVDNNIDGSIGGVPQPGVVAPPWCNNLNFYLLLTRGNRKLTT